MLRRLIGPIGLGGLLASGCGAGPIEPPNRPPAGIGTLNINVVGGQSPWQPWGSGWVLRVGDGSGAATFTVPPIGTVALTLATGTYDVWFAPPVGYRANLTAGVPTRVIVATGVPAAVAYQLSVVTSLSISVSGLSVADAGSGGVVTIVRTDVTPSITTVVQVREDGRVFETVIEAPPGAYSVSYRPPVHFELQADTPNPQTGFLTDGQTTRFFFRVERSVGGKRGP